MTDPIADYLTRLRNAIMAHHRVVEVPASNMKKSITKILFEKGYILNYKFVEDGPQGTIKVALKYDPVTKQSAIKKLTRVSTPMVFASTRATKTCRELLTDLELLSFPLPKV